MGVPLTIDQACCTHATTEIHAKDETRNELAFVPVNLPSINIEQHTTCSYTFWLNCAETFPLL